MGVTDTQREMLPAAVGTLAIIVSDLKGIFIMNKARYGGKKISHPYKPWDDDTDNSEASYRGFKACQNAIEWTVYIVPSLWLYNLYTPAIPRVGSKLQALGGAVAVVYAWCNKAYIEGYVESADARLVPFYRRTMCARAIFAGATVGVLCAAARVAGVLKRP